LKEECTSSIRANLNPITYQHAKDNGHDPATNEPLDRLLGRKFDQRRFAPEEPKDVGPDIVSNDKGTWEEKPDETLKDVVDDKMALANDQQQRHVCPCELGELEAIVTLLQVSNEEDKA
jgi:hypothetical protein